MCIRDRFDTPTPAKQVEPEKKDLASVILNSYNPAPPPQANPYFNNPMAAAFGHGYGAFPQNTMQPNMMAAYNPMAFNPAFAQGFPAGGIMMANPVVANQPLPPGMLVVDELHELKTEIKQTLDNSKTEPPAKTPFDELDDQLAPSGISKSTDKPSIGDFPNLTPEKNDPSAKSQDTRAAQFDDLFGQCIKRLLECRNNFSIRRRSKLS
eukprot:TRINITY_DN12917_c0_g1_i2.p1 TRINITY_DN12917_c0_g1~~TRINITY_DN12917_c0_g1_i2.p1  ORF type:complete len:228 (+),score=54.95 TRINITY_DN12917_c0_g1_i2:60-686(+)